jgi:hypothetical protein
MARTKALMGQGAPSKMPAAPGAQLSESAQVATRLTALEARVKALEEQLQQAVAAPSASQPVQAKAVTPVAPVVAAPAPKRASAANKKAPASKKASVGGKKAEPSVKAAAKKATAPVVKKMKTSSPSKPGAARDQWAVQHRVVAI